jgi:hypothetical protein
MFRHAVHQHDFGAPRFCNSDSKSLQFSSETARNVISFAMAVLAAIPKNRVVALTDAAGVRIVSWSPFLRTNICLLAVRIFVLTHESQIVSSLIWQWKAAMISLCAG